MQDTKNPTWGKKLELICFAALQQLCPQAPWLRWPLHLVATGTEGGRERHGALCPGGTHPSEGLRGGARPPVPMLIPEGNVVLVDGFILAVDFN